MTFEVIGDQGEVNIRRIESLPEGMETKAVELCEHGYIVGHSESGHHHVLTGGTQVLERTSGVPQGMRILYAIVEKPEEFIHTAPSAHEKYCLTPGVYEFRVAREFNSFLGQARQVQD